MKLAIRCAAMLAVLMLSGCNGCRNFNKHLASDVYGLERKVTLYAADGSVIEEWTIDSKVEDKGGTCYFIDKEENAVTISGTFIIKETN